MCKKPGNALNNYLEGEYSTLAHDRYLTAAPGAPLIGRDLIANDGEAIALYEELAAIWAVGVLKRVTWHVPYVNEVQALLPGQLMRPFKRFHGRWRRVELVGRVVAREVERRVLASVL